MTNFPIGSYFYFSNTDTYLIGHICNDATLVAEWEPNSWKHWKHAYVFNPNKKDLDYLEPTRLLKLPKDIPFCTCGLQPIDTSCKCGMLKMVYKNGLYCPRCE